MFSSCHHLSPSLPPKAAQNSHRQIRLKKLAMMQVQRTIKRTDKSKAHSAKYQSGLKGTRWLTAYQHRAGRQGKLASGAVEVSSSAHIKPRNPWVSEQVGVDNCPSTDTGHSPFHNAVAKTKTRWHDHQRAAM
jgi:hypothetical protein